MGCCNLRCGLIAGAVLGAVVVLLGGILIPVGDSIIKGTVTKEAVLENGTTAYENWVAAGVAVYRQFWLFDVLNPIEVGLGEKPIIQQKGPYTYKTRFLPKTNITFNDNYTASFLLPNAAVFDPSMSVGPEEDYVTVLNLAVAALYKLFPHSVVNGLIQLNRAKLFQKRTIKQILWGYKEPMLLGQLLGIFAPYNDTYDGPYNVFTGKDDIAKVSMIDRWQGAQDVPFWNDTYCNKINGTDASSFPPFVDKKKPLFFFSSDICRSVSAEYESTESLKGIEVYRFMLPPLTLAAPSANPDNMCYCTDPVVTRDCSMAGVLDTAPCRGGIPVYISLPHFLHGSQFLVDAVQGLSPDKVEHATYLDVEPITGFTLRFAKRLQVNMMYGPSEEIKILQNITDYTVFPLVWLNETAAMDDATADRFKAELVSKVDLLSNLKISLLAIGCIVFIVCTISACIVRKRSNKVIV